MEEHVCIKRQMNHGITHAYKDPGCLNCEQGKTIIEKQKAKETTMAKRKKDAPPIMRETPEGVQEKYCPGCDEYHPATLEYFYQDRRSKTGLSSWCRTCQKTSGSKQKRTPGKSPEKKPENKRTLVLDLAEHEDLLADIEEAAREQLRTPENQILWWLYRRQKQDYRILEVSGE